MYFLIIGALFVIRDYFEKLPYNISVASQQGDFALICAILIATEIIKGHQGLEFYARSVFYQGVWLGFSIIAGFAYQVLTIYNRSKKKGVTWADSYHNLVIVSLLVFLMGISLPIVILYGTFPEVIFFSLFVVIWIGLVLFDAETGRLNQPEWLAKHGIHVPIKRVP